jgi:transposase
VAKLSKEHIVTIKVLRERGERNCSIARTLGVTEGTVRYHLGRSRDGAKDGRHKVFLIDKLDLGEAVNRWWQDEETRLDGERPPNVDALHGWLIAEHRYQGSYKSVRRYVRSRYPAPKRRPFRRVETPPGAQVQSDWAELRGVEIGDPSGPVTLYAFAMVLSHSRKEAVIWSRSMDQLAWHRCHNEAFVRLGGVAAVDRIDNLKTGVSRGGGAWGVINPSFSRYAQTMGFHIDACSIGEPQQKGKVERRVGALARIDPGGMCFDSFEHLQEWTDAKVEASSHRRICPPTGKSVHESWLDEIPLLRPLPETMVEPFDVTVTRPVHKDCTVRFEGRTYVVPFAYVGEEVEVRGCSGQVQVVDRRSGAVLVSYERHTQARILIDSSCYEGEATERVEAPRPLGRMARKLQELAWTPVERRPLDLYAALAEVAR